VKTPTTRRSGNRLDHEADRRTKKSVGKTIRPKIIYRELVNKLTNCMFSAFVVRVGALLFEWCSFC